MAFREVTWTWATSPDPESFNRSIPIDGNNEDFRQAMLERLEDVEKWPDVKGIIYFQNITLDSSSLGEASGLPYGPNNTYKEEHIAEITANPNRFWVKDLPSQRQYPQWYISREKHLQQKAAK